MNWRIQQLLPYLIQMDECCENFIYIPPKDRLVTAFIPGRGEHMYDERPVQQVEVHGEEVILVMADDHDNPLNNEDLSDIKFKIYETVIVIG